MEATVLTAVIVVLCGGTAALGALAAFFSREVL
jgi:hypothetical protein